MKFLIRKSALPLFVTAAITYGYAYMNELLSIAYVSKSLVVPMLLAYYLSTTERINKLFLLGLFFAFCGNLVLFNSSQTSFILSMACALFFLLIHMVLIANLIGTIRTSEFIKILIPLVTMVIGSIYLIFNNESQIKILFYVFGAVLGIYVSFSYYLFRKRNNQASMLNLIGVFVFLVYCVFKGIEVAQQSSGLYTIITLSLYPIFLFLVTKALVMLDLENDKLKEL